MDQVFVVLGGLLTFAMGVMGTAMAVNPPSPDQGMRWLIAFSILALGAFGCVLGQGVVTYRQSRAADAEKAALAKNVQELREEFQAFIAVSGQPRGVITLSATGTVGPGRGGNIAIPTITTDQPVAVRANELSSAMYQWLATKMADAPTVSDGADFEESATRFVDYMRAARTDYGQRFEPTIRGIIADVSAGKGDVHGLDRLYEKPAMGFQDYDNVMHALVAITMDHLP
jgi:hypothetical protein